MLIFGSLINLIILIVFQDYCILYFFLGILRHLHEAFVAIFCECDSYILMFFSMITANCCQLNFFSICLFLGLFRLYLFYYYRAFIHDSFPPFNFSTDISRMKSVCALSQSLFVFPRGRGGNYILG